MVVTTEKDQTLVAFIGPDMAESGTTLIRHTPSIDLRYWDELTLEVIGETLSDHLKLEVELGVDMVMSGARVIKTLSLAKGTPLPARLRIHGSRIVEKAPDAPFMRLRAETTQAMENNAIVILGDREHDW